MTKEEIIAQILKSTKSTPIAIKMKEAAEKCH